MRISRSTLIGTAVAVALFGGSAFAQQTTASQSDASKTDADSAASLQEVVVTGIRYSVKASLATKRQATGMTEVATATDIGKLPDKNVADVLQRLPGVDTQSAAYGEGGFGENNRVSLRGTPASLTLTTIDGHSVATGDWFVEDQYQTVGRSVAYDLLPAEMVGKTVVNFGQNASLLEGGMAGSVDIQTRRPLDLPQGLSGFVNAGASYTSLAAKAGPQADAMLGWNNGSTGILAMGFYEKRHIRRDGQEWLGYAQVPAATAAAWQAANPALGNVTGLYYPTLVGEAQFTQTLEREGGLVDFQTKPSDELSFDVQAFYSRENAANRNNNFMADLSHVVGTAGYTPSSLDVVGNSIVGGAWPTAAGNTWDMVYDEITRPGAEAETSFINLDATFKPTNSLTLDGQAGYTYGVGRTPAQPAYEVVGGNGFSFQANGDGNLGTVNFQDLNSAGQQVPMTTGNPGTISNFGTGWAWNDIVHAIDTEAYGKLDATLKLDDGGPLEDIKFGARFSHHNRESMFAQDDGCSSYCWSNIPAWTGGEYPGNYDSTLSGPNPWAGNIFEYSDAAIAAYDSVALNTGAAEYYFEGSFNVAENNLAGYIMAEVGGDRWSGNFGVRVVNTLEEVTTNETPAPPGTTPIFWDAYAPAPNGFAPVEIDNRYFNVLPSANLKFELTHDLLLRFSAAETMSLPDYSELGGAVILTNTNDTAIAGNPDLKPVKGGVYSTDLEYYYGPESMVEGGLFDMDLTSYIDATTYQHQYYNTTNKDFEQYTVSAFLNEPAEIKGAFMSWQQALPLGFGVNVNYTFADGSTSNGDPVMGDSKHTFNVGGYWQRGPLSLNLDYSYRSHYYASFYESSQEFVDNWYDMDAAATWNVTKDISVTFNALNLLDTTYKYYANGNTAAPMAIYKNGRTYYLTAMLKF